MPRPGDVLGSLTLEAPLGAGVTAEAWRARDSAGAATFVKIVHVQLARSDEVRALFRHEIAILGRLRTPWLPRLVADGGDAPVPWLGAELVPGETLAARVGAAGPAPAPAVRGLASQGTAALSALHRLLDPDGVPLDAVHRDVAGGNLLVADDGRVRLVDLGVASSRWLPAPHRGGIRGTFRTMAPEQARGEDVDARADLFSLGAVCWEACAGAPFRTGPPARLLVAAAESPPRRFIDVPAMPPALAAALDRLVAFDPDDRYPSADEARAALAGFAGAGATDAGDVRRWLAAGRARGSSPPPGVSG